MSFFRRNKARIIVFLIAIILIIIIGVTSNRDSTSKIENVLTKGFAKIFKNINKLFNRIFENLREFKDISTLKEENKKLKEDLIKLKSDNRRYENIIARSDVLKDQNELEKNTNYDLLKTSVIGKETGNWYDGRFTIDKGSKDGIKEGDILVQAVELEDGTIIEGLVGRVSTVGEDYSKVIAIIDELNKVSFKVVRTQDGGMLIGSPEGKITGYLFDDESNIIKGDKLYTSGLGGTYKKDIYIGEVKDVNSDEGMVKEIEVTPAIDFKKVYDLYIMMD